MQKYYSNMIQYAKQHRVQLILIGAIALISPLLILLYLFNQPRTEKHNIANKPVDACKLFTPLKAQSLLGEKVIGINTEKPVVTGDISTSKCSYTDSNSSKEQMLYAAVAVQTGVNDIGVAKNHADFQAHKAANQIENINGIGQQAFFNTVSRQLHVLDGNNWLIFSFGLGSSLESNSLEDAIKLAHTTLDPEIKEN